MKRIRPMGALAVAAMAVLLSGCVKIDMQLDVSENDTVAGEMVFGLSRDMAAMAESMGQDPSEAFGELSQGLPEGAQVEEYEDDDYVGQRVTFEDIPLTEFSEGNDFTLVHEGEEIIVDGNLDMSDFNPEAMAGELGGLGDAGQFGDMDQLMESLEVSVSITFPGEVIEHNGTLDGTTVTWTPVAGEANEISARSADSGGGGGDGIPVWIWILIVVVVLGLAALLFFLSRNRDQAPPTDPAATESAGSVPPPPGGTPFGPVGTPDAPTVVEPPAPQPPAAGEQEPPAPPR